MATVTKDFRIKSGLVVEGANATVDGSDIITEDALTGGTQTNITVTYDAQTKTVNFVAENGVEDSTTDDLDEGANNKYFTDFRAETAISNALGESLQYASEGAGNVFGINPTYLAGEITDGARSAVSVEQGGSPLTYDSQTGVFGIGIASQGGVNLDGSNDLQVNRDVVDEWYDAAGAASTVQSNLDDHALDTSTHGVTGDIVGTSDSQTLSNKRLEFGNAVYGSALGSLAYNSMNDAIVLENTVGATRVLGQNVVISGENGDVLVGSINGDIGLNNSLFVSGTTGLAYYGFNDNGVAENEIATVGYADSAASTAESNANAYTDTAIGNISSNLSIAGDTGTDTVTVGSDTLTFAGGEGIDVAVTNNTVTVSAEVATVGNKGVASFANANFVVTEGAVESKPVTIGTTELNLGETSTSLAGLTSVSSELLQTPEISGNNSQNQIKLTPGTPMTAGTVHVSGAKITNLGTPSSASDAATKGYVDGAISGLDWKAAVNLLAASNVDVSAAWPVANIDGHAEPTSTYRILLTAQSTDAENGIWEYVPQTTVWSRAADADTYQELVGAAVFVMEGTTYGSSSWVQSNHYLSDFGGQDWTQFSGQGTYTAGNGLEINGNEFSIDDTVVVTHTDLEGYLNSTTGSEGTTILYVQDYVATAIETGDATATPTYLALDINSVAKQVASQTLVIDTGSSVLYSYSMANRGGKFIVVLQDTSSGHTQVSEILVTNDTAGNIAITEYAIVTTNGQLGDVDAVANGSDIEVTITGLATGTIVARAHGTIILS